MKSCSGQIEFTPRWIATLTIVVAFAAAPVLAQNRQQPRDPHISYVFPAGGQQGSTVDVVVGGQRLQGVSGARISGDGIKATLIDYVRPLTQQQANRLRDEQKELVDRKTAAMERQRARASTRPTTTATWTDADERRLVEIRQTLAGFVRKPSSPALVETVTLRIEIAPDATLERRDLRLLTPLGLSNPLIFCVGQLPEVSEKPVTNAGEPRASVPADEMTASGLPAVFNGQILAGGIDRWRFRARRGQRLVAIVDARSLIPYVPDAVPGWFQATLALCDSHGKELAYSDDFSFEVDPVLAYVIPKDAQYELQIKDSIYRGREDFVYRISIGELPFLTAVFPLGTQIGSSGRAELTGWNLSTTAFSTGELAAKSVAGQFPLMIRSGKLWSNELPFAVDELPETFEKEPNGGSETAQAAPTPLIINGRIDPPGDEDTFRVTGRAGEQLVAEVTARRMRSPLDSVLELTDSKGVRLALNDDSEDKGAGLLTHQADSLVRVTLPRDGEYLLTLRDAQNHGSKQHAYRLRISAPMPDFGLRIVPSAVNIRPGGTVALTTYALRKDGFAGEIRLILPDAPPGLSLRNGLIPADKDQVSILLAADRTSDLDGPVSLAVHGTATIDGKSFDRLATPADDMMQAFLYRHLVPAKELCVTVLRRGGPRGQAFNPNKSPEGNKNGP